MTILGGWAPATLDVISVSPSADQNNYNPSGFSTRKTNILLSIAPTASIRLTGLVAAMAGQVVIIANTSTDYLLIVEKLSPDSTNTNTFKIRDHQFLMPGFSITLVYDGTLNRWVSVGGLNSLLEQFDTSSELFGTVAPFFNAVSGTSAAVTISDDTASLTTGSTSTGKAYVAGTNSNTFLPAVGAALFLGSVQVPTLSSGTQRYQLRAGFHDAQGGTDVTDGVYWEYDDATSTDWRICAAGTSTRTKTTITGFTVTINQWDALGIYVNPGWTRADYFYSHNVAGKFTFAGSISDTNIPTGGTEAFGVAIGINKTIGSTASTCSVDYLGFLFAERARV